MLTLMQNQIDEFREHLNGLQNGNGNGARAVGRPRGKGGKNGWPEDPEERKAEMARRIAARGGVPLRHGKKKRNLSPEARASIAAAQKRRWAAHHAAKEAVAKPAKKAAAKKAPAAKPVPKGMHPRDPKHPKHAQWIAQLRLAGKRSWKRMSEAAKKERVERLHNQDAPTAKMAVAS